jgi:formylglycine-generating enzyme required for sulfatase activity/dienelactone hydrolase
VPNTTIRIYLAAKSRFYQELKRRKVFRVLVAYLVAAWLLLQVAEVLSSILGLPDWAPRLVLFLLVIGFVPALILAWAYELTPDGIKRDADTEHSVPTPPPGKLRSLLVAAGFVLAAAIGAGGYWYAGAGERWVRDVAIPQIEHFIENDNWEMAYATALTAKERAPDTALLDDYWGEFSIKTSIPSQPEGATVSRRAYHDSAAEWHSLGQTPIYDTRIPRGFSLMRIEMPGFAEVLRIVGSIPIAGGAKNLGIEEGATGIEYVVPPVDVVLESSMPTDGTEVRVPGTRLFLDGEPVALADFHIGRFEVTNLEYKAFVDAGGYRKRDYWELEFERDGQVVSWDDAIAGFVDTTGRPGPGSWVGGTFPEGQEGYPVGGISWYEAMAYARFAGRELPTVHHWRRAHAPAAFTWQVLQSNIESDGPAPVGQYEGTSWTGTSDMLGNVREWTSNAIGDKRAIVGGAWDEVAYAIPATIFIPHALPPFDRSPQNGMRLASLRDERAEKAILQRAFESQEPIEVPEPVSDEAFRIVLKNFERSPAPLNASIDGTEYFREWDREFVSFDSGDGQRSEILLYLPHGNAGRHRTVVYWPSSLAVLLTSLDEFRLHVDFMLRAGWAVAMPILEGTFHRGNGQFVSVRTVAGRDLLIRQVREMRRMMDYLETRQDIDPDSFIYYGFSWGGFLGPMALAVEPRLKLGILNQAGLTYPGSGDMHPINYLPRVRQPVLQFNGRYDTNFRFEDSAKPFFDALGSKSKKHVVEPTTHFVPHSVVIGETLAWLDEYLDEAG